MAAAILVLIVMSSSSTAQGLAKEVNGRVAPLGETSFRIGEAEREVRIHFNSIAMGV